MFQFKRFVDYNRRIYRKIKPLLFYMKRCYASAIVLSGIVMLVVDYVYLTTLASKLFGKQVKDIQGSPLKVNMLGAGITYLIMLISIMTLSVPNVRKEKLMQDSLYYGGLLGLAMYGVFDFTNLAIFKDYKMSNAIIDTLWGIVLITLVTYVGSYASYNMKWFTR